MRSLAGRVLQLLVGTFLTLALVALSQVPWEATRSDDAVVRLAWRYRSALVNACRRLSQDELVRLPQHMRRETECEPQLRPYLLELSVDGILMRRDSVFARGARADRPLSVFSETPVRPGRHAVHVTFVPLSADTAGSRATRFTFDTLLALEPRQVLLVTLDANATRLLIVSP